MRHYATITAEIWKTVKKELLLSILKKKKPENRFYQFQFYCPDKSCQDKVKREGNIFENFPGY
jgi:hypothetical protein